MIQLAKDLLTEILKNQCGVSHIFRDDDAFDRIKANPSAILLGNKEELSEKRRKVSKWTDQSTGKEYMRSQIYERVLPIEMNILHRTEDQVDGIIRLLLANLPKGMDDGLGNWVPIEPSTIDWPPDQKERALGVVIIRFRGGVYVDKELPKRASLTSKV
ncbi:hypothetical protein JCM15765_02590 [Paradesulfitobacterium aromaticivorans]